MEVEEEDYRDVLTRNYCQFSRLLVLEEVMDQLISAEVLGTEDMEVISNQYLHPSRRQKANKLIDILMTRGPDGYKKFIEVLEYQNPHLYKIVSGKKPHTPPDGLKMASNGDTFTSTDFLLNDHHRTNLKRKHRDGKLKEFTKNPTERLKNVEQIFNNRKHRKRHRSKLTLDAARILEEFLQSQLHKKSVHTRYQRHAEMVITQEISPTDSVGSTDFQVSCLDSIPFADDSDGELGKAESLPHGDFEKYFQEGINKVQSLEVIFNTDVEQIYHRNGPMLSPPSPPGTPHTPSEEGSDGKPDRINYVPYIDRQTDSSIPCSTDSLNTEIPGIAGSKNVNAQGKFSAPRVPVSLDLPTNITYHRAATPLSDMADRPRHGSWSAASGTRAKSYPSSPKKMKKDGSVSSSDTDRGSGSNIHPRKKKSKFKKVQERVQSLLRSQKHRTHEDKAEIEDMFDNREKSGKKKSKHKNKNKSKKCNSEDNFHQGSSNWDRGLLTQDGRVLEDRQVRTHQRVKQHHSCDGTVIKTEDTMEVIDVVNDTGRRHAEKHLKVKESSENSQSFGRLRRMASRDRGKQMKGSKSSHWERSSPGVEVGAAYSRAISVPGHTQSVEMGAHGGYDVLNVQAGSEGGQTHFTATQVSSGDAGSCCSSRQFDILDHSDSPGSELPRNRSFELDRQSTVHDQKVVMDGRVKTIRDIDTHERMSINDDDMEADGDKAHKDPKDLSKEEHEELYGKIATQLAAIGDNLCMEKEMEQASCSWSISARSKQTSSEVSSPEHIRTLPCLCICEDAGSHSLPAQRLFSNISLSSVVSQRIALSGANHPLTQNEYYAIVVVLKQILQDESCECLILLDGFDEWSPPQTTATQGISIGLPLRDVTRHCIIVTTMRPWKLEEIMMRPTEMDQLIQLSGMVKDPSEKYIDWLVSCLKKRFGRDMDAVKPIRNSVCETLNLLLQLREKESECRNERSSPVELQSCITGKQNCHRFGLLQYLSTLAFHTLFENQESSLVFDSSIVEIHKKLDQWFGAQSTILDVHADIHRTSTVSSMSINMDSVERKLGSGIQTVTPEFDKNIKQKPDRLLERVLIFYIAAIWKMFYVSVRLSVKFQPALMMEQEEAQNRLGRTDCERLSMDHKVKKSCSRLRMETAVTGHELRGTFGHECLWYKTPWDTQPAKKQTCSVDKLYDENCCQSAGVERNVLPGKTSPAFKWAFTGVALDQPKHPQYAIRATRMSSFSNNWPDNTHQLPQTMVDAGFYYAVSNLGRAWIDHWMDIGYLWYIGYTEYSTRKLNKRDIQILSPHELEHSKWHKHEVRAERRLAIHENEKLKSSENQTISGRWTVPVSLLTHTFSLPCQSGCIPAKLSIMEQNISIVQDLYIDLQSVGSFIEPLIIVDENAAWSITSHKLINPCSDEIWLPCCEMDILCGQKKAPSWRNYDAEQPIERLLYSEADIKRKMKMEDEKKQLKIEENLKKMEDEKKQLKIEENLKKMEDEKKHLKIEENLKKIEDEEKQLKIEENLKKMEDEEKQLKIEENVNGCFQNVSGSSKVKLSPVVDAALTIKKLQAKFDDNFDDADEGGQIEQNALCLEDYQEVQKKAVDKPCEVDVEIPDLISLKGSHIARDPSLSCSTNCFVDETDSVDEPFEPIGTLKFGTSITTVEYSEPAEFRAINENEVAAIIDDAGDEGIGQLTEVKEAENPNWCEFGAEAFPQVTKIQDNEKVAPKKQEVALQMKVIQPKARFEEHLAKAALQTLTESKAEVYEPDDSILLHTSNFNMKTRKRNDCLKKDDVYRTIRNHTWLPLTQLPVPKIDITAAILEGEIPLTSRLTLASVLKDIAIADVTPGPQITMRFELLRLCTLRNFPRENKPFLIRLAAAGFYYAAEADETICYCCGLRKRAWVQQDKPWKVHKRIAPNCNFILRNTEVNYPVPPGPEGRNHFNFMNDIWNVPEDDVSTRDRGEDVSEVMIPVIPPAARRQRAANTVPVVTTQSRLNEATSLGVALDQPKHPQYAIRATRMSSFSNNWPDNTHQLPQTMVDAGFYYAGIGDCVRCFYCGIGLRHWTEEDDPWIEHARWSRQCTYMRQVKGEEFINLVHMAIEYTEANEEPASATGGATNQLPNEEANRILLTDAAQSVLEMGYQPNIIKKAIDLILRQEGRAGISSVSIMERVLSLEEQSNTEAAERESVRQAAHELSNLHLEQEARSRQQPGTEPKSAPEPTSGARGLDVASTGASVGAVMAGVVAGAGAGAVNTSAGITGAAVAIATGGLKGSSLTMVKGNAGTAHNVSKEIVVKDDGTMKDQSGATNEKKAEKKVEQANTVTTEQPGSLKKGTQLPQDPKTIKEENEKLKEQTLCKVCLDKMVCIVFLPCGHLVTCEDCAPAMRKCPVCRALVKGTVKTYMA